jgi:hypothetical protein
MNLTAHFELASKRQDELTGLYRPLFNSLASKNQTIMERQCIHVAMYRIQGEISTRHRP